MRAVPHLILYICFLYCSDSQCTKKFSKHASLSWGHYAISLGAVFGILLSVLTNLKHYFDILHECLDITAVVVKLKNVLGLSLFRTFLGVLAQFVLFCLSRSELSNIFFHLIFSLFFFLDHRPTEDPIKALLSICLSVRLSVQHFSQE